MSVITVRIAGQIFANVVKCRIGRDLEDIAGTFDMVIVDDARLYQAVKLFIGTRQPNPAVHTGDAISIQIDGEPVLTGWIDEAHVQWHAGSISAHIQGRDKTGDLVDCAPAPSLPVQFRGVDLLHVATQVCAPFGIGVTADVDVGAPFTNLVRYKHMTAMRFLESAARQRATLLTSDGIGGLLLTRGGSTRAPASLSIGDNIDGIEAEFDWARRFSDYYVMQDTSHAYASTPGQTLDAAPSATEPADGTDITAPTAANAAGTMGHATDPAITRYRPTVRLTRSQSGMSTLQSQAEWMCRVARGNATRVRIEVNSFRAGPHKTLWRPNQITPVFDPYSDLDDEMLIAGVEFVKDNDGVRARLRVVGRNAYDRIDEADRHRHRGKAVSTSGPLLTAVPGT
ncbi:MAG TPA: hypothetical protein PLO69_11035 [Gammaproteobacteria bacterium]|nr:hypothetical protein [Gammaproteobacteria bacterium]